MTVRNRTEVISYNLNERGRDFTGVDRAVDVEAAMRLINGPAIQESVRKGDIFGFVGHFFREKYGLDVPETVIENGKTVTLEPAVKTVFIKCLPDGTVQHQQEFLPTSPGRIAQRLYQGKSYGFSSVFYAPDINGLRTPQNYFGMDFVKNPNYDTNRGYDAMLDSTSAGAMSSGGYAVEVGAMMDSVDRIMAANDAHASEMSTAYMTQCKAMDEMNEFNARLLEENRRLKKGVRVAGAMLDSATPKPAPEVLARGFKYDPGTAAGMLDSAKRFMACELPKTETPEEEKQHTGFVTKCRDLVDKVIGLG